MVGISLVPTAIISIFLVAIILGFLFGWIRGFSKSLVRFFMVLGMAVLAFFIVPSLTNTIIKADISKWNIDIAGTTVVTLEDLIGDLLRKIPIVEDLINASPTLESFISLLPVMIANILLFIVFFFVLKYVSLIIYWIIAGIFFSKKKMKDKDKHKFIGAIVGAVQGLLIACICFIPVFGVVETAQPVLQVALEENAAAEESGTEPETVAPEVYYATSESSENSSEMIEKVEKIASEADKYTSTFNNTWIIKFLNAIGVKKLSVSMFDNLTTIKQNKVTYSLRAEVKSAANVYPQAKAILESGFKIESNESLDKIKVAANELCDDEVFGTIIKEIVPYAAEKWFDGEKFCNISKPNIDNPAVASLFDAMLLKLSTDEGKNVKNDMNVSIDILKICNDANLVKRVQDGGDVMSVFSDHEELMADIINKALESNTLKAVMPEFVNFGLDVIYDALGSETAAEVTINAQDITWDASGTDIGEKVRLQKIFTNLIIVYSDVNGAEDPLEALDFGRLGATFDLLRDSQIFKDGKKGDVILDPNAQTETATVKKTSVSRDLVESLFDSKILGDNRTKLNDFKIALMDVWDDPDVSLEDTFKALKDALDIARSLNDIENLDLTNLGSVIETLAGNDALKDVVTEIVGNTETLTEMGLSGEAAAVVSETISTIINKEDYEDGEMQKDIEALVEVYDIASQVLNSATDEESGETIPVEISQDKANKLVDSLASSSVILNLITDADQDEGNTTYSDLGIAETLSDDSKTAIENALQANQALTESDEGYENKLSADQLAALNALFGITDEPEEPQD